MNDFKDALLNIEKKLKNSKRGLKLNKKKIIRIKTENLESDNYKDSRRINTESIDRNFTETKSMNKDFLKTEGDLYGHEYETTYNNDHTHDSGLEHEPDSMIIKTSSQHSKNKKKKEKEIEIKSVSIATPIQSENPSKTNLIKLTENKNESTAKKFNQKGREKGRNHVEVHVSDKNLNPLIEVIDYNENQQKKKLTYDIISDIDITAEIKSFSSNSKKYYLLL